MNDTKKIVGLLITFVIILCGAAVFVYGQVRAETENYTIEITRKIQEQQRAAEEEIAEDGVEEQSESQGQTSSGESLKSVLHVPDTYQVNKGNITGMILIEGNASISVPEVSHISTWSMTEMQPSQEFLNKSMEAFLPEGTVYEVDWDKLNNENNKSGMYDTEWLNEEEKKGEWISKGKIGSSDGNSEILLKVSDDTWYQYWAIKDGLPVNITFNKVLDKEMYGGDRDYYAAWSSMGRADRQNKMREEVLMENSFLVLPEDEQLAYAGISLEDARGIADTCMEKLGLDAFTCHDWEYQMQFAHSLMDKYIQDDYENIIQGGYLLHYVREVGDVPLTYTHDRGGNYTETVELYGNKESMESYSHDEASESYVYGNAEDAVWNSTRPWGYESVDILVTKDGIYDVHISNLYELGEVLDEKPALLDFAQVQDIFEKSFLEREQEEGLEQIYHIEEVRLGYTRIYDPINPEMSRLVPAWDFMGWSEMIFNYDYPHYGYAENYNFHSLLTINAIDGTVINREFGY